MKKLIYNLILLLVAICFPAVMHSQEIVEIGGESVTGYNLPLYMTHNYSLTQQIYTAEEIGMAGTITSVAFHCKYRTTSASMSGIRMYMMHTTKTTYESDTDIVALDDATLVYEGELFAADTGWVTLPLSTTFEYNGVGNILLCMYDTTDGYTGGNRFTMSRPEVLGDIRRSIIYYSDFFVPDINDLSSFEGNKTRNSYRCDIQLGITPAIGQCTQPSSVEVSDITAHTASISWVSGNNETSWQVCVNGEANDLLVVDTPACDLTGLAGESSYWVNVRAVCSENGYSNWTRCASFTTLTACFVPTNLTVSDIGTTTANVTWNAGGEESAWQICINNDEDNIIDVIDNQYAITGLTPNTRNYVKVRANCDTEGLSNWSSNKTFVTLITCETPTALTCTSTTDSTTISWSAASDETLWNLQYKNITENNWTRVNGLTTPTYTIKDLTPSTIYKVNIQADCESDGTSEWLNGSFSTYFLPFSEGFNTTDLPANWSSYKGLLADVMNGAALYSTSSWYFRNSALVNIYGTDRKEWLVTPCIVMDVDARVQLTFNLALTKFNTNEPVDPTKQADDKFVVLISTNDGTTWTILRQYDNARSEYVYNNIATNGEEVVIDLTNYAPNNVRIAFYGESTEIGGDVDIYVDNVRIDYVRPEVTNITATSADVTWLGSGENNWSIKYGIHGFDFETDGSLAENISQTSYSLTGLSANTSYDVYVKAAGSIKWLMTTFRTDCGIQAIPYTETFEGVNAATGGHLLSCWKAFNSNYSGIISSGNYAHTGNGLLRIRSQSVVALPQMSDINNLKIVFWARFSGAISGEFQIGYILDGGFVPLESVSLTTSYQQYIVNLSAAPAEAERIAMRLQSTGFPYVYVDDIEVVDFLSCPPPINVAVSHISNSFAVVSWTPIGNETSWQICINDNEDEIINTDATSYAITGLSPESDYIVKVRANCGNMESDWTANVEFTTQDIAMCDLEDLCEINYTLSDSYGDGWDGSAINIVDNATGLVIATWTIPSGNSATGTLFVCNDSEICFTWVSGRWDSECSYTITDANGNVVFSGRDAFQNWNYTVNCEPSVCVKPTSLSVSNISFTSATITWNAGADETAWQICLNGDESNIIDVTGTPSYNLTGLDTATSYTVKVRATCNGSDVSYWTDGIRFATTLCETSNQCEITLLLTDSYGNGWEGNAIKVTDVETSDVLGVFANEDLNGTAHSGENEMNTYTLAVCNGREIQFSWISAPYYTNEECSYVVTDASGAEIFSGSGGIIDQITHIMNCPDCRKPISLEVSDIDINSATLTWTIGNETSWQICLNDDEENIIDVISNSYTLIGLTPETDYVVKVRAVCGENDYSLWSENIPFTTLASCHVPTLLRSTDDTTSAVLTWLPGDTEENWVLQYGDDNAFADSTYTEVNVDTNPTYEITGLTPETTYYARVKAICGEGDESAWSAIRDINPTESIVIGYGNATHCYFPTSCIYKYSMAQQIYTADELGNEAQTIQSIDFYSMENCTRNLNIYMVATNKESFDDRTDWVTVSSSDRVFSGNVNFEANAWKTITFANQFVYNGISNVAIVVDDNTGSIIQNKNFRAFSATSQAICVQSDVTNLNPSNPTVYYGTIINSKNQIRLSTTEAPSCINPWSLTASNIGVNEATITWSAVPDQTAWQICINGDEENLIDVDTPTYTLTDLIEETTYTVKVRANCDTETSGWITISFATLAPFHTITATAGENGTITPSGAITVTEGEDLTFSFIPDDGYRLENVLVDGISVMSNIENNTYTFTNVVEDHTIHATFELLVSVDMANEPSVSIYPNPNNGTFSIEFGNMDGKAIYQLFDVSGAMLETRNINVTNNETVIFSHRLIVGTYFVRIIADDKVFVEKLVVE